jgi:deoxyribodipyrimidine photo-lyase
VVIDRRRIRVLKEAAPGSGPVIYLTSRDQRVDDNWALLFAQEVAIKQRQPLIVACSIEADYPQAPGRQIRFMLSGLRQVETKLKKLRIPMLVSRGKTESSLLALISRLGVGALVTDFNPLRESRRWKEALAGKVGIPFHEVDAHNVIPCWETSGKQEYAARTIRPKILRKLNEFLVFFPKMKTHPFAAELSNTPNGWNRIADIPIPSADPAIGLTCAPGETSAEKQLKLFLEKRLEKYSDARNDPNASAQSNLSPYLHFGQISAQRVALETRRYNADIKSQEAFLEELIVRRELSDNHCYYNGLYDSFEGFAEWARKTLDEHRSDPRPYLYDVDTLEAPTTHDELWNAAQTEMMVTGKMHGYLRMYWAKKILEWSPSPEEALTTANYLNNKYELDGNDPNGYVGAAWSIGGVHDRAWSEREIFGKIRYMSLSGCKRKFSVADYVARMAAMKREASA